MPTLAAIDVGSNAIRMMISRVLADGSLEMLESMRLPVRLGQDAFTTKLFSEQTMQMAVDAFLHFRKATLDFQVDSVRAVGTSALRETSNGARLIDRVAQQSKFNIEIISSEEEAQLIHLAVKNALNIKGKHAVLIDIGGGSVEVTLSDGENIISTESYGMGTVRLLQKLGTGNLGTFSFYNLVREYAASARRHIEREIGAQKIDICVGTGGNIEEIGKLRKRLFRRDRDNVITIGEIENLSERLGEMSVTDRVKKLNLRPDRADVILPASVVLHTIVSQVRAREVLIPGVGLKDGVLLALAQGIAQPQLPRRTQALASAEQMGRKYAYDADHAVFTARMAASLFEQARALHHLVENECLLLEIAARLHDIGHFINAIDHEKHGYYLLRHHPLIGLGSEEQAVVANLVRYHRKEQPSPADENFKPLNTKNRMVVLKLCALLRLADALGVSHTPRVQSITLEQRQDNIWRLSLQGDGELMLEKWTLEKRKALFQDVFGVRLEIA